MTVNGYNFEYIQNGNGEPVVFVHGSVSDYRTWTNQIEEFGKKYRTITYLDHKDMSSPPRQR